jgi:hypothetical protein
VSSYIVMEREEVIELAEAPRGQKEGTDSEY